MFNQKPSTYVAIIFSLLAAILVPAVISFWDIRIGPDLANALMVATMLMLVGIILFGPKGKQDSTSS